MMYSLGDRHPVIEGDGHFIAPTATVIGSVRLRSHASVWFGCVLRGDNEWIDVGERSNIQDGCVLHTDPGIELVVGSDVTVGHHAVLHGCRIGDGSLVGIGSIVMNGARIGARSVVGAQALVTEGKTFPDGTLILGSPARAVRELTDEEFAMLAGSAEIYVANAARFANSLKIM